MSLVTTAEVIAQVAPGVDEPTLQSVIDYNEAWLARRIGGSLSGQMSQFMYPQDWYVRLRRPTDAVVVVGADPQYVTLSADGYFVSMGIYGWWPVGPVEFQYTPNDELEVKQAVIDLCRITLSTSPYASESADVHTYTRGASIESLRDAVADRLLNAGSSAPQLHTLSFA